MLKNFEKEALNYHSGGKPGKVDVQSSKQCDTEYDLSLAYSPGVAAPCKEIAKDPSAAGKYTTRGNLVAVISNGTAVLGLGNIGPLASKPVMEGKGVLFKQFAGIDVFDLELNAQSPDEFIAAVKPLEPTFGGINLEDIKAPDCFIIEKALKEQMKIPVFHDDQHGTAIICAAALLNAAQITKRKLKNLKVVFNGAGAASIACARLIVSMGVSQKNIIMCDSKGVIHSEREGVNEYKAEFSQKTKLRTLKEALKGADVFIGLSVAGVLTKDMVKSMGKAPIIFAMANPDPEIDPESAKQARPDAIVATGRSDYPNQVNNVLGFPSIFRGALDVHATQINEEMKIAAVKALAELAQQEVPDSVSALYDNKSFHFGQDYIIPKPFDPRVLMNVAPAVAKAAMDTGVAMQPIKNMKAYREKLEALNSFSRGFIRTSINRIKSSIRKSEDKSLPTLVFPEGHSSKILKAINSLQAEKICRPVLLGYENTIRDKIKELELEELADVPIIRPSHHKMYEKYVESYYQKRHRRGVMWAEAERLMANPYYFSAMAVHLGDAEGLISGATQNYADCVRPILQIIGTQAEKVASGLNIVLINDEMLFFADTTMNIDPTAEQLANIAVSAAEAAESYKVKPRIGMLSFSNFTGRDGNPAKMQQAANLVQKLRPDLAVDGEMQADTAVNPEIMDRIFPFCNIKGGANTLIFPNLDAGNISYKLVQQLGGGEVLGPFLMGLNKPANVLQRTGTVDDIINQIVLTALQAQTQRQN